MYTLLGGDEEEGRSRQLPQGHRTSCKRGVCKACRPSSLCAALRLFPKPIRESTINREILTGETAGMAFRAEPKGFKVSFLEKSSSAEFTVGETPKGSQSLQGSQGERNLREEGGAAVFGGGIVFS